MAKVARAMLLLCCVSCAPVSRDEANGPVAIDVLPSSAPAFKPASLAEGNGSAPAIEPASPAKENALSAGVVLPRYRLFRTGGQTYDVVSYEKKDPWYYLWDSAGKKSAQLIDSVAKIVPLTDAEARQSAEDAAGRKAGLSSSRKNTTALARSSASGSALSRASLLPDTGLEMFSPAPVSSSAGYSATGIPLHVGPRGGVYHYSKSGKKVYHSRK